jgi:hypothetical protein
MQTRNSWYHPLCQTGLSLTRLRVFAATSTADDGGTAGFGTLDVGRGESRRRAGTPGGQQLVQALTEKP